MSKKKIDKSTDCAMSMISLRLPKETITELKRVAPLLGFSGYQPLIRVYITQSLLNDTAKLEARSQAEEFRYPLDKTGVAEAALQKTVAEVSPEYAVNATPSFIVGMPEFAEARADVGWGAETVELLNSLEELGFNDSNSDPVEWVAEQRRQQTLNRSKLP